MENMAGFRNWLLALLLSSPIILFFLANLFYHNSDLVSTGFIQYDNVTYAGNSIQYTWTEHKSIFYANRLNDSHTYTPIYFNPQLLILAGLFKLGIPPGIAMMLFTLFSAILFFRIVIAIYDLIKPGKEYRTLNIVLFSWGGGVLCASGMLLHVTGRITGDIWNSLFALDPAHGWWGLNAGRSLFFSLEAWYHALFFATILFILKKKWSLAATLLMMLCLSHPFSGIELLLILLTWLGVEIFINRKKVPAYFIISVCILLGFHLWYYLVYLNSFPEHHSVFQQYGLNWRYRFYHFIPAYFITGFLLVIAWRIEGFRSFFSKSHNRLFICWGLVAFTLANHELFIRPMQPIHFTRGYVWSALFLAGLPGLQYLWKYFSKKKAMLIYFSAFFLLFVSDNLLWIWKNSRRVNEPSLISHITREQEEVVNLLSKQASYNDLIVGSDEVIPYLASVRTKSNIWISHPYNTPFYSFKRDIYRSFIQTGNLPAAWDGLRIIFLISKVDEQEIKTMSRLEKGELIFESPNYLLYRKRP
jgi:hypothetical protein